MGKELYLECYKGLSCELLLSALIKLGVSQKELEEKMSALKKQIKANLTFAQAEELLLQSAMQAEWRSKLIKALKIIQEAGRNCDLSDERREEILFPGGEASFCCLAALGIGLELLGVSRIQISAITEGRGSAEASSPAPEILRVLEKYQIPVHFVENEGELLTLNSISFLAACSVSPIFSQRVYIKKTAIASEGRKSLRAMLLAAEKENSAYEEKKDSVQVLETNVDDCSGEQLGYAIDCLMKAGALDASCFPVYMKKQRPAYMLQVICKKEKQELLEDIIFRETTSIGLRRYEERRRLLPRTFQEVCLKDGHIVKIKICEHHGQKFYYPEYETVKQVCERTGRPYRNVYDEAVALAGGFYENL